MTKQDRERLPLGVVLLCCVLVLAILNAAFQIYLARGMLVKISSGYDMPAFGFKTMIWWAIGFSIVDLILIALSLIALIDVRDPKSVWLTLALAWWTFPIRLLLYKGVQYGVFGYTIPSGWLDYLPGLAFVVAVTAYLFLSKAVARHYHFSGPLRRQM